MKASEKLWAFWDSKSFGTNGLVSMLELSWSEDVSIQFKVGNWDLGFIYRRAEMLKLANA